MFEMEDTPDNNALMNRVEQKVEHLKRHQGTLTAFKESGKQFPEDVLESMAYFGAGPMYGLAMNDFDLAAATRMLETKLDTILAFADALPGAAEEDEGIGVAVQQEEQVSTR